MIEHIKAFFRDAEVYLVGSLARGEYHKAHDVDLLVVTKQPPSMEEGRKVVEEIRRRASLTPQHPIDFHFVHATKEEVLKKVKHYRKVSK